MLAHNLIQHDSITAKKNYDQYKIARQMHWRLNAQELKNWERSDGNTEFFP